MQACASAKRALKSATKGVISRQVNTLTRKTRGVRGTTRLRAQAGLDGTPTGHQWNIRVVPCVEFSSPQILATRLLRACARGQASMVSNARIACALLVALGLAGVAIADYEDYYDESYAYDYQEEEADIDCVTGDDGVSRAPGMVCDLEVTGEDTIVEGKYPGGVTGLYRYTGECTNSRPAYKREDKRGQKTGMWLFYSEYWGDWDFCNATTLQDSCVTGYGGEGYGEARPQDVLYGDWYVLGDLVEDRPRGSDFVYAPKLSVQCLGGTQEATGTYRPIHPGTSKPDNSKMGLIG
eukprot:1190819-Prorocentrum_minimum.AAC.1